MAEQGSTPSQRRSSTDGSGLTNLNDPLSHQAPPFGAAPDGDDPIVSNPDPPGATANLSLTDSQIATDLISEVISRTEGDTMETNDIISSSLPDKEGAAPQDTALPSTSQSSSPTPASVLPNTTTASSSTSPDRPSTPPSSVTPAGPTSGSLIQQPLSFPDKLATTPFAASPAALPANRTITVRDANHTTPTFDAPILQRYETEDAMDLVGSTDDSNAERRPADISETSTDRAHTPPANACGGLHHLHRTTTRTTTRTNPVTRTDHPHQ